MNIGDIIERDGKKYIVTDVWGQNFGMREYKEEAKPLPVFEAPEEIPEEAPKKKVVRRKKA